MAHSNDMGDGSPVATPTSRLPKYAGAWGIFLLGLYLVVSVLIEIGLVIEFWPEPLEAQQTQSSRLSDAGTEQADSTESTSAETNEPAETRRWKSGYCLLWYENKCHPVIGDGLISDEQRIIVLVVLAGGVGGMVHALRSFAAFVGNRVLTRSWLWWYVLRPFEGTILALVFYLVLRGGLLASNEPDISVFGVVAISSLVGMFSHQAVEKLKDVAETLFTKPKTEGAADKLPEKQASATPSIPVIESFDPAHLALGASNLEIIADGKGFAPKIIARVDGQDRETTYVSETELTFVLAPSDVAVAGDKQIVVVDMATGAKSAPVKFTVT